MSLNVHYIGLMVKCTLHNVHLIINNTQNKTIMIINISSVHFESVQFWMQIMFWFETEFVANFISGVPILL